MSFVTQPENVINSIARSVFQILLIGIELKLTTFMINHDKLQINNNSKDLIKHSVLQFYQNNMFKLVIEILLK